MSSNKSLNQKIDEYILANPKTPGEVGYYTKIASQFNIHPEKARKRWRMLQAKNTHTTSSSHYVHVVGTPLGESTVTTYNWSNNGDSIIDTIVDEKIENLEDLVRVCNINTDQFDITHYQVKTYSRPINGIFKQVYSVKASLKAKKTDIDTKLQKDIILEEIRKYSPQAAFKPANDLIDGRDTALEINIPDLHIGKLAWGKETGEDYDIKIALERYRKAVYELISRVNTDTIERFILPVGNDMINVDNAGNTTTAGTNVSCDSRFGKMFQSAKELLIETIERLATVAPVDVVIIPGNHDTIAMFTLGEVLDAWFHNNQYVNVINTHTPRKYYKYGSNLVMYTHGHREKLQDLGIICATEQPQLWAETKFRRVHVGHFHHSKQIKFTDVQEYPGFTVKVLNSLSANDAWHAEKGYNSLKAAEAFLYHREKGLLANYYYYNQV